MSKYDRRVFLSAMAAAAATTLLPLMSGQDAQPAQAGGISFGAWQIPAPNFAVTGNSNQSKANDQKAKAADKGKADQKGKEKGKGLVGRIGGAVSNTAKTTVGAARQATNTDKFAHLYIKAVEQGQEYFIHGVPVDLVTNQPRTLDDAKGAELRIVVFDKAQHDAYYTRNRDKDLKFTSLPDFPLEDKSGRSIAQTVAVMLDNARAVNELHTPYVETPLNRAPTSDGNAAFAAMVYTLVGCAPDCSSLQTIQKDYRTDGVNFHLLDDGVAHDLYRQSAEAGDLVAELLREFKMRPVRKPAAAQPKPPGLVLQ